MTKEIPLTRGKVALVDDDDHGFLSHWSWCASGKDSNCYAAHRVEKRGIAKTSYMHRLILDAPNGLHVHHINGDKLDNRRANLKLVTPSEHGTEHDEGQGKRTGHIHVLIDPVIHEAALAAKAVTGITLTDVVESALADWALETVAGTDILVAAGKFPGKVIYEREEKE